MQIGGATVTAPSVRLIRRIRRDFPRGTDDDVIVRLTALSPDDSSERIQAALVLGAAGKWSRFERQLRRLEKDWREVLAVGGLADDDWPARLAEALPGGPESADQDGQTTGPIPSVPIPSPRSPRRDASAPRRDASAPRRTVSHRQPRSRPR